jgi:choline monooxygenase
MLEGVVRHPASEFLDSSSYKGIDLPPSQALTLPPWCYTSPDYFDIEAERVFARSWNFFGRADRIPEPGDFFTVDYVGNPIIILRDQAGSIRAFANTCRHRGTQLLSGEGKCKTIICPYHGWSYGLDGSLKAGRGLKEIEDFDRAQNGLHEFRVGLWGGFIFVNLSDDGGSLEEWLGDLPDQMASYDSDNLVLCRRVEFDVACNWKSHIENSVEDYHVPYVHSYTLQKIQGGYNDFYPETRGNWLVMREQHEGTRALLVEDLGHALPRIATLEGHAAEGTNFVCLFPSTLLAYTVDSMWYIELLPQSVGHTKLAVGMCFPKSSLARPDFSEKSAYYYKRWVKAVSEDNGITEKQLIGLRSPFATRGRLTPLEPLVPKMARWWIDKILNGHNAGGPR